MQAFDATDTSATKAGAVERADSRRPLQYICEAGYRGGRLSARWSKWPICRPGRAK